MAALAGPLSVFFAVQMCVEKGEVAGGKRGHIKIPPDQVGDRGNFSRLVEKKH